MDDETSNTRAYSTVSLIRDIGHELVPYRARFWLATFLRASCDLARLYPSYALSQIITLLTRRQLSADLFPVIVQIIALSFSAYMVHIVCRQSAKYIGFQVAERVALDAQLKSLRHLFRLDMIWQERENSGNKMKRILKGGESLNRIIRIWITNLIEVGVNFIGITIVIASFDRFISVSLLCFIIAYYAISSFFIRRAVRMEHLVSEGEEDLHGLSFESVNNIRSVRVLGMAGQLFQRLQEKSAELFTSIRRRIFWYQSHDFVLFIIGKSFVASFTAFIVWGILHGRYEVGFLVLFVNYFEKLYENVDELSRCTQDLVAAKVGVARMMEILHEPLTVDTEAGKQEFPKNWNQISVRNLRFGYRKDQPVLQGLSFDIKRGERIGIVGLSGGGKSTLFKLLLKEREDYDGSIAIDNVHLKDISRVSYCDHSAVVLQDTEVFNFTLRDNVTIASARPSTEEKQLKNSIATAHVSDFLHKLPAGIDTFIGEKGIKLSGGEKQRLGIARALYKQPQILFLDEATSHLDLESEERIRDSLHQFFQTVTAVVIAHRLSTIKEMDRIIVLENGMIIESGTFEELYAKKGRFHELWEKQKF